MSNTKVRAKKGDILIYENLTFQKSYFGVVIGRNKYDNGYDVIRLTENGQPFIMAFGGVDFDTAFDENIKKVYSEGLKENGEKLFPNR